MWTSPTECLKVLRQSEASSVGAKRYASMLTTTKIVISEQGITGIFVGLAPTVLLQASSVGVRFMLYDPVKSLIVEFPDISKVYLSSWLLEELLVH